MVLHRALVRLLTMAAAFALVVAVVAVPARAEVAGPADVAEAISVPGRIVIAWDRLASPSTQAEIRGRHGLRIEETPSSTTTVPSTRLPSTASPRSASSPARAAASTSRVPPSPVGSPRRWSPACSTPSSRPASWPAPPPERADRDEAPIT